MSFRSIVPMLPAVLLLAWTLPVTGCGGSGGGTIDPDPVADILLEKQGALDLGADQEASPGDLISYTLDVTNTGEAVLTGVTVVDPSVSDLDCGGGTNVIGLMTSGETVQCVGTYAITQADIDAGQRLNTAVAEGTDPNGEPVSDDDTHTVVVPGPPLSITGEYAIDVQILSDSCGFGTGPGSLVMHVEEQDVDLANVDIPIGGAGGTCDPRSYTRSDNTLTRIRTSESQSGECLVRAEVITVLSFLPGGTVGGSEVNSYSEAGGDCSQLELPCAIELTVTGARCTGCYDCTVETGVPGGRSLEGRVAMGPLASGVASP